MCGSSFFPNTCGLVPSPRPSSVQKCICSDIFEGNGVGAACPLLTAGTQALEGTPPAAQPGTWGAQLMMCLILLEYKLVRPRWVSI